MTRSSFRRPCVLLAAASTLLGGLALLAMQTRPVRVSYRFNSKGELIRPEGYREWVVVGTPVTPNDMNRGKAPFPEIHHVYIDRGSFAHWKKTGEFRDGTILMKELISVGSKKAASGNGYFMGEFIGLEATIKDQRRFPDEPGHWAYFSFTDHDGGPVHATAEAFPAADCNACHDDNADDDWVFTQYYPVLRAAKPGGPAPRGAGPATREAPTTRAVVGGVPTNKDDLFAFVKAGKHKSWAHESKMRETDAPHGTYVIAYLNSILDASLKAGNTVHPVGSAAVKEMFDENRKPFGWAVSVKARPESDRGKGWYWYETLSTTDPDAIPTRGTRTGEGFGAGVCIGCHGRFGVDYVTIPYPLE